MVDALTARNAKREAIAEKLAVVKRNTRNLVNVRPDLKAAFDALAALAVPDTEASKK